MRTDDQAAPGQARDPEAVGRLVRRLRSTFAFPPSAEELFSSLTGKTTGLRKPFAEIGIALQANISGLISTVSVPYTLAHRSAADRHWQRIYMSERIRSTPLVCDPDEQDDESRNQEALIRTRSRMDSFLRSEEGTNALIRDTLGFLDFMCSDGGVVGAANELIRQGVVLCWGAFEVFGRDCFIAHLNAEPARTLALIEDPVAKRRFELSKVSLETLATHNFNLSERMGTLLAQQQDLSDLYSMKSVYQALFPDDKRLADALSDTDLRLLSLRRNLIVHRCGVIDEAYVVAAHSCEQVGDRLKVSPDNLEVHIATVIKAATAILDAVSTGS